MSPTTTPPTVLVGRGPDGEDCRRRRGGHGGIARRASQPTTPTYAAPKSPRCMTQWMVGSSARGVADFSPATLHDCMRSWWPTPNGHAPAPQARHQFTLVDQVTPLVNMGAAERRCHPRRTRGSTPPTVLVGRGPDGEDCRRRRGGHGGIARRASQPTTPTYAAPKSPPCMIACDHGSLPQRFGPTQRHLCQSK